MSSSLGIALMPVSLKAKSLHGSPALTLHPVWQADLLNFRSAVRINGLSFRLFASFVNSFLSFAYWSATLGLAEWSMDTRARAVKRTLWLSGLIKGGSTAAEAETAGLRITALSTEAAEEQ